MSFATRLADKTGKSPVYTLEFEGNTLNALAATAGWVIADAATNLTTNTKAKLGNATSISFDKTTGNVRATISNGGLSIDLRKGAYRRLFINFSALTDVASMRVRLGTGGSVNSHEWTITDTALAAQIDSTDWVRLYLSTMSTQPSGYTYTQNGTPSDFGINFMEISILFDAAGDTLTDILVNELSDHPHRISTGAINTPVLPTRQGWLNPPKIGANQVRIQDGQISVGGARALVVDDGGDGTEWDGPWGGPWPGSFDFIQAMRDFPMPGRGTTLRAGFRGDVENDTNYSTIHLGIMVTAELKGQAWELNISDNLERYRVPIMEDATDAAPVTLASDNIIDQLLKLALSTGNGNNDETGDGTAYDSLTASQGAGIPEDFFDVPDMETERDDWLPADTGSRVFVEPTTFLAEAVAMAKAYGFVLIVKANGLMSIDVVRPAFGAEAVNTFDESNVIAKLPRERHSKEQVYNQVFLRYNHNQVTDEFDSDLTRDNAESQTRYGVRRLPVDSKWIDNDTVAKRVADRLLNRLGDGSPPARFRTLMTEQPRELGETITLDMRNLADIDAGNYNTESELASITRRTFDPASSSCEFECQFTSYQQGNYRLIGPAAMGDYDTQTQAQKDNYGSISNGSGTLGSDMDPEHIVGPG